MGKLTHTVSGSIASFKSADKSLIESLKVYFDPVQSGSGDPSPTNVRPITGWTGVNTTKVRSIWDGRYEAGYINDSGIDSNTYLTSKRNIGYIPVLGDSKIIFKYTKTENVQVSNIMFHEYNSNNEFLGQKWVAPNTEYTLKSATSFIRFHMDGNYAPTYNGKDLIVYIKEETETIPVTIPAGGKNLCPPLIKNHGVSVLTGTEYSDTDNVAVSDYIPVNFTVNPTYYLSGLLNTYHSFVAAYNINKQFLGRCGGDQRTNLSITSSIFNAGSPQGTGDIAFLRIEQYNITTMTDIDTVTIQLEIGSTATDYEPYISSMYGGYVDLATGDVYKEWNKIVYDGSEDENWTDLTTGSATAFGKSIIVSNKASVGLSGIQSNYLNFIPSNATWGNYDNWISEGGSNITTGIQSIVVMADWREYLAEHNLEVVYKLSTPIKIATLTPTELKAFKGQNNIWSDANGNIECTYSFQDHLTKKRRTLMNDHKVTTTSAPIANFNSRIKGGILNSCIVEFSPVQSGTGDPSPTNIRPISGWTSINVHTDGKNIIDKTTLTGTSSVWWEGGMVGGYTGHCITPKIPVKPGATYYLDRISCNSNGESYQNYVSLFDKDQKYIKQIEWAGPYKYTQTLDDNVYYVGITIGTEYVDTAYLTFVENGTNYAQFVERKVVSVTFPDIPMGKNLLNPEIFKNHTGNVYSVSNDVITINNHDGQAWDNRPKIFLKAGTYTVTRTNNSGQIRYSTDLTNEIYLFANDGLYSNSFTLNEDTYVAFKVGNSASSYPFDTKIMIEAGSTATVYNPYTNEFPGGYIDLSTGEIYQTWGRWIVTGVENYYMSDSYIKSDACDVYFNLDIKYNARDILCNQLCHGSTGIWMKVGCENQCLCNGRQLHMNIANDLLGITDYTQETQQTVKTKMRSYFSNLNDNGNPVIVYYPLDTLKYVGTISPTQLKTLLGTNNIWADTNGNTTVTYWTR